MANRIKTISDLVRENPNDVVRGRFKCLGPMIGFGGWYPMKIQIDGQEYESEVYSYANDVIIPVSVLSGKLVFSAVNYEVEDRLLSYGNIHPHYSDEEFKKINGCERQDVAKMIGAIDQFTKYPQRESQGEVLVYPYFGHFYGHLTDKGTEAERGLFGMSVQEAVGLELRDKEEFKKKQKTSWHDLRKKYYQ